MVRYLDEMKDINFSLDKHIILSLKDFKIRHDDFCEINRLNLRKIFEKNKD